MTDDARTVGKSPLLAAPYGDEAWFAANPGRQAHIREVGKQPFKDKQRAVRFLDEQELAFRSLPAHDVKLRRMILWRVPTDNPMFDPAAPQILKIPFILMPGEVIEDTDERLVALIHELMVQEAVGDEAAVGRQV